MNLRCLIVDDEELCRSSLRLELEAIPGIEIIGECANGIEAVRAVQELEPDLMFLDIQMPRLDGFDLLELLGPQAPGIVFVTAHDEYALRAFEAQALDYLLKPARAERLKRAVEKFIEQRGRPERQKKQQEMLAWHRERTGPRQRILVRLGHEVHVIPVSETIRIEAEDDYVRIHTASRTFLKSERLNQLEKELDPSTFCRIHRSHLLNISFLRRIEPYSKESFKAILANGDSLPISRSGLARLKNFL